MQLVNKLLTVIFVLVISIVAICSNALAAAAIPFQDISDSYAKQEIVDLYNKHIIAGTKPQQFEPHKTVTRAEFVAMMNRLLKVEPVNNQIAAFVDVPGNAWFYNEVQAAINLGLVQGTSEHYFSPKKVVTRQEAAVILVRALKQNTDSAVNSDLSFSDANDVASWAVDEVNKMNQLGLMKGSGGEFRPEAPLTREETAAIMYRVLHMSNWSKVIQTNPASTIQMGWQLDQSAAQFIDSIKKSHVNTAVPRWFFIEKTGTVSNYTDTTLLNWTMKNHIKLWALFGNHSDSNVTHEMLSTEANRSKTINQIVSYVKRYHLNGINMDFENVAASDRDHLTSFVASLASVLHQAGAVLSIDVSPDLGSDWTAAFDYAKLGTFADYVVLMAYDEHWGGGAEPGSVSSLPWFKQAIDKQLASVPSSKTIVALPFYTRDWSVTSQSVTSSAITLTEQVAKIKYGPGRVKWDDAVGQYVVSYTKQGVPHYIWAEDSRSLSAKYEYASSRNVKGFAYWYMGAETADIWTSIHNLQRYTSYEFK
ncbi:S-layer-like y domain-containing protein [Paenibacillus sediminis]|uniref:Spore germination protein YaaH n=1 Tax=Paenibacillus sediminis TaxID=664909 RepID=A0ABS4H160_9BACL|nr:S-layer homology domain-containing protein [Paenibacillus sediminis]MBP1936272.1 spore germination protein YaaH [Paenibacillus sediminis]